jgi:RNA polymerase sigma-32 factor
MTAAQPIPKPEEIFTDEFQREWLDGDNSETYPVEPDAVPDLSSEMSALDVYMARLRNLAPLSDEQQSELARRYKQEDDQQAGQLLLMTNLRLVIKLAMDYTRERDDLLELIQEGNVGISKALDRYDPSKNVKFTSYAQYWIRAKILDYLINRSRPIRLGSSRAGRKIFYNLNKAKRALKKKGIEPTPERIAEYLDVDKDEVIRVGIQMEESPMSLDEEISEDGGRTLGDIMESGEESPEEMFAENELMDRFQQALRAFGEELDDPRRRAIWFERTVAEEPKILRELGADWDVSKERIRQIESELCNDFRRFFTDELGGREEVDYAMSA